MASKVKKNVVANYIGQIYAALIAALVMPQYLNYLGSEAFGLVAFFTLFQAWMNVLDVGLTPTLGRYAALVSGKKISLARFWALLKSFEMIFLSLAAFLMAAVVTGSSAIVQHWLHLETVSATTAEQCVLLMGAIIGLRWFCALYKGGINGFEDQIWMNVTSLFFTSLKFLGSIFLIIFISSDLYSFFTYQLAVAIAELLVITCRFYSLFDAPKVRSFMFFSIEEMAEAIPFALSLAYTSALWTLISQSDKFIFSTVLTLSEFGYFSLVTLLASSLSLIAAPFSQALVPRLTLLHAQKNVEELEKLYRTASNFSTLLLVAAAVTIACNAEALLYSWTGNAAFASWGVSVLVWFTLGHAVVLVGGYPYYLQKAMGQLRLHVIGSTMLAAIHVPLIAWAAITWGPVHTGLVWFSFMTIWFFVWTPVLHASLIRDFHLSWLLKDILPTVVIATIVAIFLARFFGIEISGNRIMDFMAILAQGGVTVVISSLLVPSIREKIWEMMESFSGRRSSRFWG